MTLKRNLDTTIIALVLVILSGVIGIYVLAKEVLENEQKAVEVEFKIQSEYLLRDRYDELFKIYQQINAEGLVDRLSDPLPSQENFLDVVKELEQLSRDSGMQISMRLGEAKLTSQGVELASGASARPGQSSVQSGGANYDFITIEASLRGNYAGFSQFINLFSQANYFMNIDSIVINRTMLQTGGFIDVQLLIRIYVEKIVQGT